MVDYTRRTHIVRCPQDKTNPDDVYVDVEVLDALAFKGPMGEELVLNFKKGNISVWRDDDTGGGNEKHEGKPTRRSHMERKKHGNNILDVEVLDAVSFKTKMGQEYILNLPSKKSSKHSTNDTSDGGDNTRRTHTEKISEGFKRNPTEYAKIIRTDQVAFRTIMGKEMIVKMPSSDDPNSSASRATTYISTPRGYDPTNEKGPKPPINEDPNIYVSFPKTSKGPFVQDDRISQGMLWWIRKIKSGGGIVYLTFEYEVSRDGGRAPREPKPTLTLLPYDESATFQIMDDVYRQIDLGADPIEVENPVSPAMFSGLYHWTPQPAWRKVTTDAGPPATVYFITTGEGVIDADNAFLPYPGTDLCGAPITYGEAYGGSFFRCNGTAEAIAASAGFTNTFVMEQGAWTNLTDATYASDAFNAFSSISGFGLTTSVISFDISPPVSVTTVKSRAVFALNIGKLKEFADPGSDVFIFQVRVPESRDGGWKLKGQAYKDTKDFPLDTENKPLFSFTPEAKIEKPVFTEETVITGSVNFGGDEPHLTLFIESGGGEIGGEG